MPAAPKLQMVRITNFQLSGFGQAVGRIFFHENLQRWVIVASNYFFGGIDIFSAWTDMKMAKEHHVLKKKKKDYT